MTRVIPCFRNLLKKNQERYLPTRRAKQYTLKILIILVFYLFVERQYNRWESLQMNRKRDHYRNTRFDGWNKYFQSSNYLQQVGKVWLFGRFTVF